MKVSPLTPLGARVEDVDITALTPIEVAQLARLLADRGVLVFPGCPLDDHQFESFLRGFGALTFTKGETAVAGHPDLNVVTNVGRSTPPKSSFHVDTSYVADPPAYTALRAVTVPGQGGETVFCDQNAAWCTLSPALRDEIAGRTMRHVVTGVDLDDGDEREAEHLLARPHPLSGEVSLYLTTLARCGAVSGLSLEHSRELVERLYAHSTRADNLLAHTWAPDDVVMWDNARVMHRADHARVDGDRVLHRGMVAAFDPVPARA